MATNIISNSKKALFQSIKSIQLSQIDQIRAKTRRKTAKIEIVWAKHAIQKRLHTITIIKKIIL